MDRPKDLEEVMIVDPEEGIADLDMHLDRLRREPGTDLLSQLVTVEDEGARLSPVELRSALGAGGGTLEDVFVSLTTGASTQGGEFHDISRTRRTARRLG